MAAVLRNQNTGCLCDLSPGSVPAFQLENAICAAILVFLSLSSLSPKEKPA